MSDHLLILTDDEARLLGSLYSLGAMGLLALSLGTKEEQLFQESRRLVHETLKLEPYSKLQHALRDKVLSIVAEIRSDAKGEVSDA